jgi:hypothetical protein
MDKIISRIKSILVLSFISYCLFLRYFSDTDQFLELHSQIHKALFLGKRLNIFWVKQSLIKLGIMHLFVLSGMHFFIACKFTEAILPKKYHMLVPLVFLSLWEANIPVIRSFFYCFYQAIDRSRGEKFSGSYLFFLSLLSSCFFISSPQDYHSLWLSSCFFLLIQALYQNANLSQSLGQFLIFCLSPFILPFATSLSPLSFLANILLAPVLLIFFYLSPILHILPQGEDLCQDLLQNCFLLLDRISQSISLDHPFTSHGKNYLILNLFLAFVYWRIDSYRIRRSL